MALPTRRNAANPNKSYPGQKNGNMSCLWDSLRLHWLSTCWREEVTSNERIELLEKSFEAMWDLALFVASLQTSHRLYGDENEWANRVLKPANELYNRLNRSETGSQPVKDEK
jgi:hypothetical protein